MKGPILLATLEYPPQIGGIAEYLRHAVDAFPPGAVHVLAPSVGDQAHEIDMRSDAPIYRRELLARFLRPRWLPALYWTDWLAKKERPSLLLVSHLLPMGDIARIVGRRYRIPYGVIVHGMDAALAIDAGGAKKARASRILAGAAFVVANSAYTAHLVGSLGVPAGKIAVVRPSPSFPATVTVTEEQRADVRRRYALGADFTLLSVSRLVARKGIDDVIDAIAELRHQGVFVRYLVAGDGPERKKLERKVAKLELQDRVRFAGAVPHGELPAVFAAGDAFVLVPKSIGPDVEGFGIVYLEANLVGRPVIGSRSGGVPDAVIHEKTGLLVDAEDRGQLVHAVRRLMGDRDLRRRLGEQGRRRVIEEFDWRRQMSGLVAAATEPVPA
jgi:phosphatidylinositol alpha-1,6-mannosyltransferase